MAPTRRHSLRHPPPVDDLSGASPRICVEYGGTHKLQKPHIKKLAYLKTLGMYEHGAIHYEYDLWICFKTLAYLKNGHEEMETNKNHGKPTGKSSCLAALFLQTLHH